MGRQWRRLRGVVLHTQTGRKERFDNAPQLCVLLAGMVRPHGPSPSSLVLKDRVGDMCTEEKARALGARLFNRSKP